MGDFLFLGCVAGLDWFSGRPGRSARIEFEAPVAEVYATERDHEQTAFDFGQYVFDCAVPFQHRAAYRVPDAVWILMLLQPAEQAAVHDQLQGDVGDLHQMVEIEPRVSYCAERLLQSKPMTFLHFELFFDLPASPTDLVEDSYDPPFA